MHVELVVPALLPAQAAAPALELLLARGRRSAQEPAGLERWLARAFVLEGDGLPAGALTALAAGLASSEQPGDDYWLRADPVHLRADRDRVLLIPSAGFAIDADEAAALAAALSRHFAADFSIQAVRPDAWVLRTAREMPVQARMPLDLAGRNVDAELPDKRFHALLNEIQMALYDHPVNTAREARGAPVVNGAWLWGAGRLPAAAAAATTDWQSVSADDPIALGLAALAKLRHRAPGPGAGTWLARAPEDGRHLVLLDGLRGAQALGDGEAQARGLAALETHWFAPLLAALRAGRIGMLTVHLPEAGLSVETVRGDLHRFWRRARPLSAYAAGTGA